MRLLLPLLILLLPGCADLASQRQILARAKAEVAAREPWSDLAYIRVERNPGLGAFTWQVSAGALDRADYPDFQGISLVPGTQRELRFTPDGCLLSYGNAGAWCATPADPYAGYVPEELSK